ncbi:winged helix-turn-helix domain-containing protein [Halobacteria archaeon HArc-gm2]|nr:winged helix-turn-helix domain-containing protein [Halobacteria archaeon HArc-gm2]
MSRADTILECEDCVAPADAFALVSDETRLSILEALWRLDDPVRFSELRSEVGVRDSAQFNYHLTKLTDQFVRKVDGENSAGETSSDAEPAGYELRTAGERIVQAILAGSFTEHPRREIDIDDACTQCGAELAARYDDEVLAIDCPDCGHGHGEYPFPPGGLHDRSDAEILEAFDQRVRHLHCLAKDGVCPECSGRMNTTIERAGECCLGTSLRADHVCEQCNHQLCSAVGLGLLDHSDVVSFYGDHDVALSETPYWRLEWCVDDESVTVLEENPWKIRIDISENEETLRVTVDGDLSVVDTERV